MFNYLQAGKFLNVKLSCFSVIVYLSELLYHLFHMYSFDDNFSLCIDIGNTTVLHRS